MRDLAASIIQKFYQSVPKNIIALGGGFYGRVFRAELNEAPFNAVVKIYLCPGLAAREALQLQTLARYAIVSMPAVYFTHMADTDIPHDALVMEYIPGINAGTTEPPSDKKIRERIADTIVDNLIAYHRTVNPKGFGDINADTFEPVWQTWYRPRAEASLFKAERLYQKGAVSEDTIVTVRSAYSHFDKIFYLPVKEARLIHSDYNTWNVLLHENGTRVEAVIDPFNACWADAEMDLFQLNNANGRSYRLLPLYQSKFGVSENFWLKNSFYELFSEISHFHDANVDLKHSNIPAQAYELRKQMNDFGLLK